MRDVLEKTSVPLDFSTYKYKIEQDVDKSNAVIIGQYNIQSKQFEGVVRRISTNYLFEGQWSDKN